MDRRASNIEVRETGGRRVAAKRAEGARDMKERAKDMLYTPPMSGIIL